MRTDGMSRDGVLLLEKMHTVKVEDESEGLLMNDGTGLHLTSKERPTKEVPLEMAPISTLRRSSQQGDSI